MKHNYKITLILLGMFILTQLIGLYLLNVDPFHLSVEINGTVEEISNPYLAWTPVPPEDQTASDFNRNLISVLIAFLIVIPLIFLLSKFGIKWFLKVWFFSVVFFALWMVFYTIEVAIPATILTLHPTTALIIPIILALPLAFIKIYRKSFLVHNFTELLVYPGLALILVPFFNIFTIIILLILFSIYDLWAVWKSGIMQKMAKYHIEKLNIFPGFFVPHMSKATKAKIKKLKQSKKSQKELGKKKFKVNIAILGGGDVVFPLLAAGVVLKTWGMIPALIVTLGATLGISYLFFFGEKKKFYPALPFISAGVFAGMLVAWLVF